MNKKIEDLTVVELIALINTDLFVLRERERLIKELRKIFKPLTKRG